MVIKTEPLGWEVDRSLRQFHHLRQALLIQQPDTIVPALPYPNPDEPFGE